MFIEDFAIVLKVGEGAWEEILWEARCVRRPEAHPAQAHQEGQQAEAEASQVTTIVKPASLTVFLSVEVVNQNCASSEIKLTNAQVSHPHGCPHCHSGWPGLPCRNCWQEDQV